MAARSLAWVCWAVRISASTAAQQTQAKIRQAYEYLLEAMEIVTPGSQEGNVAASKVLENLALLQEYLGPQGQEIYQSLIEGE